MLRICILIGRFPPAHLGGAELQAEEVAKRLSIRHKVTVVTRGSLSTPVNETRDGFTIFRTRAGEIRFFRTLFHFCHALSYLAKKRNEIDVLLCYQPFGAGLLGVLAGKITGIPVIVSPRGKDEIRFHESVKLRSLSLPAIRHADLVFVQSGRMKKILFEEIRKVCGDGEAKRVDDKTVFVPNMVRIPGEGSDSPGKTVLFIGRLIRKKGADVLLEAVRMAGRLELVIAGEGPEMESLEEQALGLDVTFMGRVEPQDIPELLRRARVLVLPSRGGEGLPNVVIEAMSAGVPVIATDVGGTADVVGDGLTGFVISPGDAAAMAERLRKIFSDDNLWRKLSRNSRKEAEKYRWENVLPLMEEMLADVAARRKGTKSGRQAS